MRWIPLLLAPLLLGAAVPGTDVPGVPASPSYAIVDIGTLGGAESDAEGLNNRGQVVGSAATGTLNDRAEPLLHAYIWRNGVITDLDPGASVSSAALALNDRSQVVGVRDYHAVLWSPGRPFVGIEPVDEATAGCGGYQAVAINNSGQIVESGWVCGDPAVAVWWRGQARKSAMTMGQAYSINGHGQVAGVDIDNSGTGGPVSWQYDGTRLRLLRHLAPSGGQIRGWARAVNDRGVIAGELDFLPVLWSKGIAQPLGLLPGFDGGTASSVDAAGVVVGTCRRTVNGVDETRAFIWQAPHRLTDLNSLLPQGAGWELREAAAVNNRGQIAGTGLYHGVRRGFLMSPQ